MLTQALRIWQQTCGWYAVLQISVPKCWVLLVGSEKNGWLYSCRNVILIEIFAHNEERIKMHLLLFRVVSLDSKAKRDGSVTFL